MINHRIILLILIFLGISQVGYSQKKAHVDTRAFIETDNGGILIFNSFNGFDLYFYIDIKDANVQATDRNNLYNIDKTVLQVLAVKKNIYKGDNDKDVLENFAIEETKYNADYLKTKLNPKVESLELDTDLTAKFWYYDFPQSISKEVKSQQYIIFVYKDYIVSINTAQFEEQKFAEVKEFLIGIFDSIKFTNQRITLEYLCKKRD